MSPTDDSRSESPRSTTRSESINRDAVLDPDQHREAERRRKRKARLILLGSPIALLLAWLVIVFFPLPEPDLIVSTETTYLTGPLRPDGSVDYIAAINQQLSEGVTPENNAAVILLNSMGPTPFDREIGYLDQLYKNLVIPPLPTEGDYFIDALDHLSQIADQLPPSPEGHEASRYITTAPPNATSMREHFDQLTDKPWLPEDEPHAVHWLQLNQVPLDNLHNLQPDQPTYWPIIPGDEDTLISVLLPQLAVARGLSRALGMRIMMHIATGNHDQAVTDILALFRIADAMNADSTLIDRLVTLAIRKLALHTIQIFLETDPPQPALQRLLAGLDNLRALKPFSDIINFERLGALDQYSTTHRLDLGDDRPLDKLQPVLDINIVLSQLNDLYDRLAAIHNLPDQAQRRREYEQAEQDIHDAADAAEPLFNPQAPGNHFRFWFWRLTTPARLASHQSSRRFADITAGIFIPSLSRGTILNDHTAAQLQLIRTAVALALHKHQHGSYPDSLDPLTPHFLPDLPLDPFTNAPLIYTRRGDGYTLHSIGPDLTDQHAAMPFDQSTQDVTDPYDMVYQTDH